MEYYASSYGYYVYSFLKIQSAKPAACTLNQYLNCIEVIEAVVNVNFIGL